MSTSKGITTSKFHTRKRTQYPCEIAVCSRTSAAVARECALALCKRYKVPSTSITVFLESKDQLQTYSKLLSPDTYHKLVAVGASGPEFYNALSDMYPVGCHLVILEDFVYDILDIKYGFMKSFVSLIKRGFAECESSGAHLWGVYPGVLQDGMKTSVSHGFKLLHSGLWGCINPGSDVVHLQVHEQEMPERCILYWTLFHAVVRLNTIGLKQHGQTRTSETSCRQLKSLYPEHVVLKETKNGHWFVRLRETKDGLIGSS